MFFVSLILHFMIDIPVTYERVFPEGTQEWINFSGTASGFGYSPESYWQKQSLPGAGTGEQPGGGCSAGKGQWKSPAGRRCERRRVPHQPDALWQLFVLCHVQLKNNLAFNFQCQSRMVTGMLFFFFVINTLVFKISPLNSIKKQAFNLQ